MCACVCCALLCLCVCVCVRVSCKDHEVTYFTDVLTYVMQEMCHFVSNLDQFVVDRLLCGAWMQLEQVCFKSLLMFFVI